MNLENCSAEERLQLISEALTIPSRHWTKNHVQVLPKQYLLQNISTFTLTKIWKDLPEHFKNDEEFQSHLPCLEHYNRDGDSVHIDGPPPSKLRCRGCIRERRLREEENRKQRKNSDNSGGGFRDNNNNNRTEISTLG